MENHFTRHILSISSIQFSNWFFYPDLPFKISSCVVVRWNFQNFFLRQLHQMILNFLNFLDRTVNHIKTAWHFESQNIVTVRDSDITTSSKFVSFGAIQNIPVLLMSLKGFIHKRAQNDQGQRTRFCVLYFFNFFIRFP